MHNLFIVIVQSSFETLKQDPPKQGDETSDEEEEKKRTSVKVDLDEEVQRSNP